jgi:methyl-accepting chemotaxis protein
MTVKKKLFLAYGALSFLILLMGTSAIWILHVLSGQIDDLARTEPTKLYLAGEVDTVASDMLSLDRAILLDASLKDQSSLQRDVAEYEKSTVDLKGYLNKMQPLLVTSEGKRIISALRSNAETTHSRFLTFCIALQQQHIDQALAIEHQEMIPVLQDSSDIGSRLLDRELSRMTNAGQDDVSEILKGHWIMMVLMCISIAAGVVLIFIVRALDAQLRHIVGELSQGADQVASAASQVSSSSHSLAQDTSRQAAAIEETSASTEEISSMARRNADTSHLAADLVSKAQLSVEQANLAVLESVHAMKDIEDSSGRISKIIAIIEQIAFQTNILALNAAVEAARAGESGKGFAVVADEVRTLAQRCAQAAQDTSALIEESIQSSSSGKQKVMLLAESGHQVSEIFSRMKTLIEEISQSSHEQGRGVDQIGRAISQMERGTQKSAANAEQGAAAAEQLTAQSKTLQDVAAQLSRVIGLDESNLNMSPAIYRLRDLSYN